MKRLILVALAGISACQAKPTGPSVIMLQCDGLMISDFGKGDITRSERRITYKIDPTTNTISYWNPDDKQWSKPSEGVQTTSTTIKYQQQWASEKAGEEGASNKFVEFDRTLGNVSEKIVTMVPGLTVQTEYNGKCVAIDEPSEERAF